MRFIALSRSNFDPEKMIALLGSRIDGRRNSSDASARQIVASWAPALAKFRKMREQISALSLKAA